MLQGLLVLQVEDFTFIPVLLPPPLTSLLLLTSGSVGTFFP